mgnify:CR=1 FL=1
MATETTSKDELLSEINKAVSEMYDLTCAMDKDSINTVPFENSWTAGQLLRHVSKSISGMATVMEIPAREAERNAAQRVPELRDLFLDFSIMLKSPESIEPEEGHYSVKNSVEQLTAAYMHLKESATKTDIHELVEGLLLGPITKLELLHFVLYHTQRHLHQLKNIVSTLTSAP